MEQDPRDQHPASVLGRPGRHLLSLRHRQRDAAPEGVRRVPAPGAEPEDPAGAGF